LLALLADLFYGISDKDLPPHKGYSIVADRKSKKYDKERVVMQRKTAPEGFYIYFEVIVVVFS